MSEITSKHVAIKSVCEGKRKGGGSYGLYLFVEILGIHFHIEFRFTGSYIIKISGNRKGRQERSECGRDRRKQRKGGKNLSPITCEDHVQVDLWEFLI